MKNIDLVGGADRIAEPNPIADRLPSGRMSNTSIRPKPGTYIEFRAERDVLVAVSACPDLTVGGKEIRLVVLDGQRERGRD